MTVNHVSRVKDRCPSLSFSLSQAAPKQSSSSLEKTEDFSSFNTGFFSFIFGRLLFLCLASLFHLLSLITGFPIIFIIIIVWVACQVLSSRLIFSTSVSLPSEVCPVKNKRGFPSQLQGVKEEEEEAKKSRRKKETSTKWHNRDKRK